jgi:hypothetical protein
MTNFIKKFVVFSTRSMKAIAILLFFFVLYSNEQIPAQTFYGISNKSDAKIKGLMEKYQSIANGNKERLFFEGYKSELNWKIYNK